MNEEQRKQISELNRKHFTEFGVTGDGRLCYQWMRTDEMPIEFGRGYKENIDRETGLWLAHRQVSHHRSLSSELKILLDTTPR